MILSNTSFFQNSSLKRTFLFCFFLISLAGYLVIAYGIERSNFIVLIITFGILFLVYFLSLKWISGTEKVKIAIAAALLFRASLLFSTPTLSDDFFRFIWDARLLAHGINPFAYKPEFFIQNGMPAFLSADLFNQLNSQIYYSVYPAVCQYIFWISVFIGGQNIAANIVVMKIIMAAFEAGTFWMMAKLLRYFKLPLKYLLIYALNPLIIFEITGNLHFEGVMIFFLLAAFYLFLKKHFFIASLCFLLAINTKLLPLILFPYLMFSLGWQKSFKLIGMVTLGTLLLHLPFLDSHFLTHFADSLALYFQSFEFNASIYYLVRWAGYQIAGYNIINIAAPALAVISAVVIMAISWKMRNASLKNLPAAYILIVSVYLFFATTVHPWYITSLIAFVPFTRLKFPLVWSAVVPLTYVAYTAPAYNENLWLVAVEYLAVIGMMGYDFYYRKEGFEENSYSYLFDRKRGNIK